MAPVTRSMSAKSSCECFLPALRARADPTPGVKKAPGKSSVQRKTREKKAATLPPMPSPPPAAPGDSTDNRRGPFIEWYSIKTSDFKDAAALSELVDILREAARQPGCKIVVQEKPAASTTPTFFVIEWRDAKYRGQFLESETSKRLTQAVKDDRLRQDFLVRLLLEPGTRVIYEHNEFTRHGLVEVLTAYFPANLSDTTTQALERISGPQFWGGTMSGEPRIQHPLTFPGQALIGEHHGWAEGLVEYQGQRARRMVYILKWLDALGQQQYKQHEVKQRTRDGRILRNEMEIFFNDLEELGMLGYETQNTQFLEIGRY